MPHGQHVEAVPRARIALIEWLVAQGGTSRAPILSW
jgi:hypothetical protein